MPKTKNTGAVSIEAAPSVKTANKKKFDPATNPYVPCMSMVREGILIYSSKRSMGYTVVWNSYMEIQPVELNELISMKNTDYGFFKNNYIIIPDDYEFKDDVIKYLHVENCYQNVSSPYKVDSLFGGTIEQMVAKIGAMSADARNEAIVVAKKAIADGEIDSYKRIHALEDVFGCSLI